LNKIGFALVFLILFVLASCGQYGDLYAPVDEQTEAKVETESLENSQESQERLQEKPEQQVKQEPVE